MNLLFDVVLSVLVEYLELSVSDGNSLRSMCINHFNYTI